MAAFFWVGGAGTWNNATTTNWAASSGGAGGAGVPTAADTATIDTSSGAGTITVASTATCSSLTCNAPASKLMVFSLSGNVTFPGNVTINGNSRLNQLLVNSSVVGTQRTWTINGTLSVSNCDFSDILGAGSASWDFSAINSVGDALGNSGLTFILSTTQTATVAPATSKNFSDVAIWTSRVPLVHDDVSMASVTGGTLTLDLARASRNLDWTGATGTPTWNLTTNSAFYGSYTLTSLVTLAGNSGITLAARSGSPTITSAGKTFNALNIGVLSTTAFSFALQDAIASNNRITAATKLVTNNFSITLTISAGAGLVVNTVGGLDLGTSSIFCSGASGNIVSLNGSTVVNGSGSTIAFTTASTSLRSISAGLSNVLGTLTYTIANSPGALQISNAATFTTYNIGSGRQLIITASTTETIDPAGTFNVNGVNNGYLYLPGLAANYVSAPNAAPLQITGDITIDADIAPNSWTPGTINVIAAKAATSGQFCYQMYIDTTGKIAFVFFANGTTATTTLSTVATGLSATTRKSIRVSWQADDGAAHNVVKIYTSPDGSTWTQLGTTVTNAGASASFNGTSALEIGTNQIGTANPFAGIIYEVKIYNSYLQASAGTPVFDANFTTKAFGANTFTESSANAATVTINGALAQCGDGRVSLVSSSGGVAGTLSKSSGIVSCDYLVIQDSTATGGAGWYAGTHSVFVSNVTGWNLSAPPSGGYPQLMTLGIG